MDIKLDKMWTLFLFILAAGPASIFSAENPRPRNKRQYYVCPAEFIRAGKYCYYFSQSMATWQDAFYKCKDRDSDLATPQRPAEDKAIRRQLNAAGQITKTEWWLGGIYDWEQMQWKWGASGNKLEYHGFSKMGQNNKEKLKWHCTIMDPRIKYRWNARSCVLGKHFICQKPLKKVTRKELRQMRKKDKNINGIPVPVHSKYKHDRTAENLSNGHGEPNLKHYNINVDNAYGHAQNSTVVQRGRGRRRGKGRKHRRDKNKYPDADKNSISANILGNERRNMNTRRRRNKSKESKESKEVDTSIENIVHKTTYMNNTLNPLHPMIIVEEHDYKF